MEFKENVLDILNVINESNAARREATRPAKEAFAMQHKAKPMKRIIIDNDASRKLVAYWEKLSSKDFPDEKGDGTGKILLEPDQKKYGGYGAYAVWESVKGKAGMYADVKNDNGTKWAFTELWLSEAGAKKLQNNIRPLPNDFLEGDKAFFGGAADSRRRRALKIKNNNKEELEKDSKKVAKINKEIEDTNDWKKYDDLSDKRREIEKKYDNVIEFGRRNRQSPKIEKTTRGIDNNIRKIVDRMEETYRANYDNEEAKKEYWRINSIVHKEIDPARQKGFKKEEGITPDTGYNNSKEVAKLVDKLKIEVDNYIKKYGKKFNY